LPPLLFHAGSTEMLLDDSVRGHDRARQAGVAAEIEVWLEMPHVFHVFSWLPEANLALHQAAAFIVDNAASARHSLPQVPSSPSAFQPGLQSGVRLEG
jgi:acetyl esterase/lipase